MSIELVISDDKKNNILTEYVCLPRFFASILDKLPYNQMPSPDLIERVSTRRKIIRDHEIYDSSPGAAQMTLDDKPTPGALTFRDLYIEPVTLESVAIQYLRRFRSNAVFDLPFEKGEGEVKKGVYHIID